VQTTRGEPVVKGKKDREGGAYVDRKKGKKKTASFLFNHEDNSKDAVSTKGKASGGDESREEEE